MGTGIKVILLPTGEVSADGGRPVHAEGDAWPRYATAIYFTPGFNTVYVAGSSEDIDNFASIVVQSGEKFKMVGPTIRGTTVPIDLTKLWVSCESGFQMTLEIKS